MEKHNLVTTASRPTKVYGWKFTHHGWISNHYLENQPLVGKPTTLWLEILPPSQPHRYHDSALYILFDKGKVEENSTSWNRPLKDGEWGKGTTRLHSAFFNLHCFASSFLKISSSEKLKRSAILMINSYAADIIITIIAIIFKIIIIIMSTK